MDNRLDFDKRMQCLAGTFAIENLEIPSHLGHILQRLDAGEISFQHLVENAKKRYAIKPADHVF